MMPNNNPTGQNQYTKDRDRSQRPGTPGPDAAVPSKRGAGAGTEESPRGVVDNDRDVERDESHEDTVSFTTDR